jgi:hypothetical protein
MIEAILFLGFCLAVYYWAVWRLNKMDRRDD